MSIYIPGLEMPTSCCQCPVNMEICKRDYKYLLEHLELYDNRADDCPLVPVPDHGRLIDADAAIADIRGEILEYQMNGMKGTPFYIEDLRTMWKRLEDEDIVPTIIQAEEEKKMKSCKQCDEYDVCSRQNDLRRKKPRCPKAKVDKPTTNYDRLISKTPEELVEWIESIEPAACPWRDDHGDNCRFAHCRDCWLSWLKSTAEEGKV